MKKERRIGAETVKFSVEVFPEEFECVGVVQIRYGQPKKVAFFFIFIIIIVFLSPSLTKKLPELLSIVLEENLIKIFEEDDKTTMAAMFVDGELEKIVHGA